MWLVGSINMKYPDNNGFTLIELMLALTLAGMMITMVPPMLGKVLPGVTAKSLTNDLSNMIRESRARAIFLNQSREIYYNSKQRSLFNQNEETNIIVSEDLHFMVDEEPVTEEIIKLFSTFPDGSISGRQVMIQSDAKTYAIELNWLTGTVTVREYVDENPI
jgi:general secretion pathway protein H